MRTSNISFRHLRAFISLVEQKNFSRAAEQSHLSQSAFSALIQMLEQQADVKLFDRTTRSVELTEAGKLLERWARKALDGLAEVSSELENHITGKTGRVGIAISPSLAASWLPPIIAKFHTAYPDVKLQVFDEMPDDCINLLRSGSADFALTSANDIEADLTTEQLFDDPFCVVCRKDHPLAKARTLKCAELHGHAFIHLHPFSTTRQQIDPELEAAGVPVLVEVKHMATLIGLVTAGMGVTILPRFSVARFYSTDLVSIPLQNLDRCRSFSIIRLRDRSLSASAALMLDLIAEHKSQLWTPLEP